MIIYQKIMKFTLKFTLKSTLKFALSSSLYLSGVIALFLTTVDASAFVRDGVEVNIVDAGRVRLPSYHHRGEMYVLGRHQQRYLIELINHSARRIEVVMTVDGRDVINGQLGAYHHRGYVVDPYEKIEVEGFRRSAHQVATFRFTTPGDSYSGRRGTPENVGVIGVAIFNEASPLRYRSRQYVPQDLDSSLGLGAGAYDHAESTAQGSPRPSATKGHTKGHTKRHHSSLSREDVHAGHSGRSRRPRSRPQRSELGTQYGETRHSSSVETSFKRTSDHPTTQLVITYDSEQGLRRRGVIRGYSYAPQEPRPFPGQYAPSPY